MQSWSYPLSLYMDVLSVINILVVQRCRYCWKPQRKYISENVGSYQPDEVNHRERVELFVMGARYMAALVYHRHKGNWHQQTNSTILLKYLQYFGSIHLFYAIMRCTLLQCLVSIIYMAMLIKNYFIIIV